MRFFHLAALLPLVGQSLALLQPNYTTSAGVSVYNPGDFFTTTGPWSLMSHAGDSLYIAGTWICSRGFRDSCPLTTHSHRHARH